MVILTGAKFAFMRYDYRMSKRRVGRPRLNMVRFTVSVTPELHELLIAQAAREGRSLAVHAGMLLAAALQPEPCPPESSQPAPPR